MSSDRLIETDRLYALTSNNSALIQYVKKIVKNIHNGNSIHIKMSKAFYKSNIFLLFYVLIFVFV